MQLSLEIVRVLIESEEEFPVDLDDAWSWLGFRRKEAAKKLLFESFERDLDFSQKAGKATGGRPSEVFMLTVDCFKSLGMMAGTPKGKEIRKYFLECERQLKELVRSQPQPTTSPQAVPTLPPAPSMSAELSPDSELYQLLKEVGNREIVRRFFS